MIIDLPDGDEMTSHTVLIVNVASTKGLGATPCVCRFSGNLLCSAAASFDAVPLASSTQQRRSCALALG